MAVDQFDYVVVGGGTAGAVVAARLSEDPSRQVCLIEAGPSDLAYDEVLKLRRWLELLGGPLDYGYRSTVQPNGNSHIVHSRARVLGGCSSHNMMIWFKPLPGDWNDWERRGSQRLGRRVDGALLRAAPEPAPAGRRKGPERDPVRLGGVGVCGGERARQPGLERGCTAPPHS